MAKDTSYMRTPEYREKIRQGNLRRYALNPMSEETKKKIGLGNSGKAMSLEHRLHISQAKKGKPRRHYTLSEEARQNISVGHIKFWKEHPEKKKNIGSKTRMGNTNAKGTHHHSLTRSQSLMGNTNGKGIQKRSLTRSQTYCGLWRDRDYVSKMLRARDVRPNKQELKLGVILQNICPNQFQYNGDFSLGITLNGFIPDFVNVNGKKQVIEFFGTYFHKQIGRGEEEKIRRYKEIGWDCLVVWDTELSDKSALEDKIRAFSGVG